MDLKLPIQLPDEFSRMSAEELKKAFSTCLKLGSPVQWEHRYEATRDPNYLIGRADEVIYEKGRGWHAALHLRPGSPAADYLARMGLQGARIEPVMTRVNGQWVITSLGLFAGPATPAPPAAPPLWQAIPNTDVRANAENGGHLLITHAENPDRTWRARVRWDGCLELYCAFNGQFPEGNEFGDTETERLHICDLNETIERLQALRDYAKEAFGGEWPQ